MRISFAFTLAVASAATTLAAPLSANGVSVAPVERDIRSTPELMSRSLSSPASRADPEEILGLARRAAGALLRRGLHGSSDQSDPHPPYRTASIGPAGYDQQQTAGSGGMYSSADPPPSRSNSASIGHASPSTQHSVRVPVIPAAHDDSPVPAVFPEESVSPAGYAQKQSSPRVPVIPATHAASPVIPQAVIPEMSEFDQDRPFSPTASYHNSAQHGFPQHSPTMHGQQHAEIPQSQSWSAYAQPNHWH